MIFERLSSLVVQLDRNSFMKSSLQAPRRAWLGAPSKLKLAKQVIRAYLVSSGRFGLARIRLTESMTTLPGSS